MASLSGGSSESRDPKARGRFRLGAGESAVGQRFGRPQRIGPQGRAKRKALKAQKPVAVDLFIGRIPVERDANGPLHEGAIGGRCSGMGVGSADVFGKGLAAAPARRLKCEPFAVDASGIDRPQAVVGFMDEGDARDRRASQRLRPQ